VEAENGELDVFRVLLPFLCDAVGPLLLPVLRVFQLLFGEAEIVLDDLHHVVFHVFAVGGVLIQAGHFELGVGLGVAVTVENPGMFWGGDTPPAHPIEERGLVDALQNDRVENRRLLFDGVAVRKQRHHQLLIF